MTFLRMPQINKDYLLASGPFECPTRGNLECTGGPCRCESCLSLLSHVIHLLLLDVLLLFKSPNMKGLMFFDAVLIMSTLTCLWFLSWCRAFFPLPGLPWVLRSPGRHLSQSHLHCCLHSFSLKTAVLWIRSRWWFLAVDGVDLESLTSCH